MTAIPCICALIAAYLIPGHSDVKGERRRTAADTLAFAGASLAGSRAARPGARNNSFRNEFDARL